MLKKACIILFSIILVLCFTLFNNAPVFSGYANEYELYFKNGSNINTVKIVNENEYHFNFGVKGESCVISRHNFCLSNFLKEFDAKQLFCEKVNKVNIYYAYSPKIKYLELINGQKVNLQVAITNDYVKVGSPLIYGSF